MPKLIQTVDLVTNFYTYEGVVKALNRVNLTVDHGETFGLVGESGCGKSVAVRSMMRIIQSPGRVDGGQVLFYPSRGKGAAPVDLLQQSKDYMEQLRGDQISMIFQEPNAALNPIMRIGDQVAESYLFHRQDDMCTKIRADLKSPDCRVPWPLKRALQWTYRTAQERPHSRVLKLLSKIPVARRWQRRLKQEAMRRSVGIIARLGIPNADEVVQRYPHNLSGGMKQRIVIAMALACQPLLLIADEATSNLDVTIQAQILELLRDLRKDQISSILLITHDLGVVAETCDRVGVMYAGNLCEVAPVADLFNQPRHPYSRALLNSVPRIAHVGELQSIEGNVPNLVDPPAGCRFHPRCAHVMDICRRRFPQMVKVAPGHQVACYLYTDRPRAALDET